MEVSHSLQIQVELLELLDIALQQESWQLSASVLVKQLLYESPAIISLMRPHRTRGGRFDKQSWQRFQDDRFSIVFLMESRECVCLTISYLAVSTSIGIS